MKSTTTPRLCYRVLALLVALTSAETALAGSSALVDLLAILRDKGTLSAAEYQMLVDAAKADEARQTVVVRDARKEVDDKVATVAKQSEALDHKVEAVTKQAETLAWAEKIKLKGDVRTRYEYTNDEGAPDRGRGRVRYRLGVIAAPVAGLEAGAGLASGSGDQRSTNQSFDSTFSGKNLNLDYAYMQYAFGNGLSGIAGKFSYKNYLWTPDDLMWDSDINPEGLSLSYSTPDPWGNLFANAGLWVLEENSGSSDDPYMVYGQLGQIWKAGDWFGTAAATVYDFADINYVTDISAYDGRNTDSKLGSVNLALDVGRPVGAGELHFFGEYIENVETSTSQDTAWSAGGKYTFAKWTLRYVYADVDLNAVPDFLPDSDRYKGFTGVRGHEFEIDYELMKQVLLALNFYHVEDKLNDLDEDLLQADINVKF